MDGRVLSARNELSLRVHRREGKGRGGKKSTWPGGELDGPVNAQRRGGVTAGRPAKKRIRRKNDTLLTSGSETASRKIFYKGEQGKPGLKEWGRKGKVLFRSLEGRAVSEKDSTRILEGGAPCSLFTF